jgi:hypothetical protein
MDTSIFLKDFINKINDIRNDEFNINNFKYKEKIEEKKIINENVMEFRNFKNKMIKKALKDKMKPSNIGKKEYEIDYGNINILEDDIFHNTEQKSEEVQLNIEELSKEQKLSLVKEFLQRKVISLEEHDFNKLYAIMDDENFVFKKYITFSKMHQQISKISFIKKLENGTYTIDLNEKKSKNKNLFFK